MTASKKLILDANILIRAAFGKQVRDLLNSHGDSVEFSTPDVCVSDAREHLARVAAQRGITAADAESLLNQIVPGIVQVVDLSLYEELEQPARARIARRDPDDWPVVADALLLDAPIWTEDKDFFGIGIPTWTTDKIELYLRDN